MLALKRKIVSSKKRYRIRRSEWEVGIRIYLYKIAGEPC